MYFKNLNIKNKPSLLQSMNLDETKINNFVVKLNQRVLDKSSKSLALLSLDDLTKEDEKCFCYLGMIGYQSWINNKIADLKYLDN